MSNTGTWASSLIIRFLMVCMHTNHHLMHLSFICIFSSLALELVTVTYRLSFHKLVTKLWVVYLLTGIVCLPSISMLMVAAGLFLFIHRWYLCGIVLLLIVPAKIYVTPRPCLIAYNFQNSCDNDGCHYY